MNLQDLIASIFNQSAPPESEFTAELTVADKVKIANSVTCSFFLSPPDKVGRSPMLALYHGEIMRSMTEAEIDSAKSSLLHMNR